MGVSVARGATAFDLLSHEGFCGAWERLTVRCPHATPFQAHPFIRASAQAWEGGRELILVYATDGTELRGLVALEVDEMAGTLTHVGADLARRQGWLAPPLEDGFFFEQALGALARAVSARSLCLGPLPDGIGVEWVGTQQRWGRRSRLGRRLTAWRGLREDRIEATPGKRANGHQLAQMQALGPLHFEVADDARVQDRWIERAIDWADHQRWVLGRSPPELSRSVRLQLWRGLAREGIVSVTALHVGEAPASLFVGVRGSTRLYVDMAVESPRFEQHSPGIVHLAHLEPQLLAEGLEEIDVTGSEPWLCLHADGTRELADLTVFFNRRGVVAHDVKERVIELSRRALS